MPQPTSLQHRTLRAFTALHALRGAPDASDWPGSLILAVSLDAEGAALSIAANIAGAVCLTLEPDPALLRAAQRNGACDFVVNTLDEALRAIKNEIRQHRPLSVALEGDPTFLLEEIIARGVAPQLFTAPRLYPDAAARLQSCGSLLLMLNDTEPDTLPIPEELKRLQGVATVPALMETFLSSNPWQLHEFTFATAAELRAFDASALDFLVADRFRRQWLTSAPRLFPRDRQRTLWLNQQELAALPAVPLQASAQ